MRSPSRSSFPRLPLRALAVASVVPLVGCDGASKYAAVSNLASAAPARLVPNVLELVYTENHDTAFTVLRGVIWPAKAELLAAVAWVASFALVIAWWNRRRTPSPLLHLAFALTLAGAIGNALDRVTRGFVVDFVHLHAGKLEWPVFNLADVFVVVGAGLFAVAALVRPPVRRYSS